jgi:hypothetical protein
LGVALRRPIRVNRRPLDGCAASARLRAPVASHPAPQSCNVAEQLWDMRVFALLAATFDFARCRWMTLPGRAAVAVAYSQRMITRNNILPPDAGQLIRPRGERRRSGRAALTSVAATILRADRAELALVARRPPVR